MVEYFRTDAHRFFQGFRANRLNHEFLNVDVVVSVLAAVDDVHHRQWHGEFARVPFSSAMCSYSGMPLEAAAAFAAAGETARMALAPKLDLFSVPSRSIMILSMFARSLASLPSTA